MIGSPGPDGSVRFERYVAIGDSSTEGLDDPDGLGGYHGWANRLAARIAALQGGLLYANLGVRGRTTKEILEEQLEPALAMRPNLSTFFAGTNDVVANRFDVDDFARDVATVQGTLVRAGATVVSFTLPDLTPVMPLAKRVMPRVRAMNDALRAVSAETGAILVDVAAHPVASDPRLWSEDRLHANALGHARIAQALAHALGLPDADDDWAEPLAPAPSRGWAGRIGAEMHWGAKYLVPWVWRSLRGRSSGDGQSPKRPTLEPFHPGQWPPNGRRS